jgi:membrane dipeptidase
LPWNVRKFVHNQILSFNFTADLEKVDPWARSNWSHTDLPRLRRGMVGAQVSTPACGRYTPRDFL